MGDSDKFEHFVIKRRGDDSFWELGRGAMGVRWQRFWTLSPNARFSRAAYSRFDSEWESRKNALAENLRSQSAREIFGLLPVFVDVAP
jgi:hypothetical protein